MGIGSQDRAFSNKFSQGRRIERVIARHHGHIGQRRSTADCRLVGIWQSIPALQVDHVHQCNAAFPPAGVIIVIGDLVEAQPCIIIGADKLGSINRAFLQCLVDITAGKELRHGTNFFQDLGAQTADADLQTLHIFQRIDLLAEPAPHLRASVSSRKTDDVVLAVKCLQKLHAITLIEPCIGHALVEAEGQTRSKGKGRILVDKIIGRRMGHVDQTILHGIQLAQ